MKVLLIDDDVINRKILAKALENMGHVVLQNSNGRQGWETLFDNSDIELLITDMVMPDMDGRELIILVRSNYQNPDLPIIIISGVLNLEDIQDILEMGFCYFCAKPIDLSKVKLCMSKLLEEVAKAQQEAEINN